MKSIKYFSIFLVTYWKSSKNSEIDNWLGPKYNYGRFPKQ